MYNNEGFLCLVHFHVTECNLTEGSEQSVAKFFAICVCLLYLQKAINKQKKHKNMERGGQREQWRIWGEENVPLKRISKMKNCLKNTGDV